MTPLTAAILKQKAIRRCALAALPFLEKVRTVGKIRRSHWDLKQLRALHPNRIGGVQFIGAPLLPAAVTSPSNTWTSGFLPLPRGLSALQHTPQAG